MKKEILINAGAGEIRVAIVEDDRLQELFLERTSGLGDGAPKRRAAESGGHSLIGNIVLGRVQRVLPGMQAAFVDIGLDRAGFLGAREARCLAETNGLATGAAEPGRHALGQPFCPSQSDHSAENLCDERAPRIGDCVREGEEILVQVVKDPIGEKGARLSANVTMPGRLLVLVPNQPGIALSRRIDDDAERVRLSSLCEDMVANQREALAPDAGYIVRSAAIGAELAELREDAESLSRSWIPVAEKRRMARAPATLHHDLDPIERTMRDEVDADTVRVAVDDREALEVARDYCRRAMPQAESMLELFKGPGLILDDFEDDIEQIFAARVPLPSGGWITIESTEALTAIDVNSGSFISASGLEETSLRVNLEAAAEIGRQLRLRGIGGLIVVDFIHVGGGGDVGKVLGALSDSLSRDHTPTQILPMSEFGLVEITRKRVRDPLARMMTENCRACHGRARARSCETVALEILRRVEREAHHAPGRPIAVRASPEVVDWIGQRGAELRAALARRNAPRVTFEPRSEYAREGYDVAAQI
ncbi:MAG TPA: Rne/Rng family ribonuclease [Rhizomicrobium sp.]|jgi:ribonuclease G